jgi:ABC-2 type transport system ATP-binding protein
MDNLNKIPVLQVKDLSVSYGNFQAVKQVSFNVMAGEIFGLSW